MLKDEPLTAPTCYEILYHVTQEYGHQFRIFADGQTIKMRQGLNRGVNIRVVINAGVEIDVVPRTFLDDKSKQFISLCATGMGFIFLAFWIAFLGESTSALKLGELVDARSQARILGMASQGLLGSFFIGCVAGGAAAVLITVLASPRYTLNANRLLTRDVRAFLEKKTGVA